MNPRTWRGIEPHEVGEKRLLNKVMAGVISLVAKCVVYARRGRTPGEDNGDGSRSSNVEWDG